MVRLIPNQKLVVVEKNTNAIYFVVVASEEKGILTFDIKGILNLKYVSRMSMHIYDLNRFCRFYELYDFYDYYEEQLTQKFITNRSTDKEMNFEDFKEMMNKPTGYLILRIKGEKKKEFTKKEYEYERSKYLSLMHLAVNINNKTMYDEWCEMYESLEKKWQQKEAT